MNTLPAGTVHDTSYYIKSEKVTFPIPGGGADRGRETQRQRDTHRKTERYSLYYKDL